MSVMKKGRMAAATGKAAYKSGRAASRGARAVGIDSRRQARIAAKIGKKAARRSMSRRRSIKPYLVLGLPLAAAGGALALYLSIKKARAGHPGDTVEGVMEQFRQAGDREQGYQRPGEQNVTGARRDFSEPSSGPLIGEERRPEDSQIGTGQDEVVEQRIRSRIGEDPRVQGAPRISVEVNDGIAELRGPVASREIKTAIVEIAFGTQGVTEVRDLLEVEED